RPRHGVPCRPQTRALSDRLDAALGGLTLEGYEPIGFSNLKTVVPAPETLVGRALEHVARRGKYVSLEFGDAGRILVHLSQAGRVDLEEPPKKTRGKGGVVRVRRGDGGD